MKFDNTTQKIWYLPQVIQFPTSTSVVAETMRRLWRVASEGQKENNSVTCDLAIAKLAMEIQAEGKSTFDKSFISLRSFHLEMAFFFCPGKSHWRIRLLKSLKNILDECKILAKGSINSFLRGKSYKRCKRMHEFLALVFEILRFESYLTTINWEVMGTTLQEKKDLERVKY